MSLALRSTPADWAERIGAFAPVLILSYFLVQLVLRVTAPGGLGLDEAEQMVATQALEWGYGAQPPLYTWLQIALFSVFGESKIALSLLKNACLAAILIGLWTLARRLGASPTTAAAAAFGALFLPSVAWEAQRALTHSVLASALAVWTMIAAIDAARSGRIARFALLGLLIGAGLLAKGTYAFFLAGLLLAALATPPARDWRWAVALLAAGLLLAAPGLWAYENWALTTSATHKFGFDDGPGVGAATTAAAALAVAVASSVALLLAAFLLAFRVAAPRRAAPTLRWEAAFLERAILIGVAAVAAVVFVSGATEVKERWLQPIAALAPVALALRFAPWIVADRFRWYLAAVGAVAALVSVAVAYNLRYGGKNPSYQSAPFAQAATAAGLDDEAALISDFFLAGNLRRVRPDLAALTPQMSALPIDGPPTIVIWWRRDVADAPPPSRLKSLVADRIDVALDWSSAESATFFYPAPHEDRQFHLFWMRLDK